MMLTMISLQSEAAVRRCYSQLVFLKMSQYSQENTYIEVFLIKDFIKKRLQHRYFSCKYCETFKNSFFIEYL